MINLKRQFMDFLYDHPKKDKQILEYGSKWGYVKYSPAELLREIEQKTELGLSILDDIEFQQESINLFFSSEEHHK